MNRLFGTSKPKKEAPSLTDAIGRVDGRVDSIEQKIRKLDTELAQYRDQLARMPAGPAKDALKQRALRTLQQRKMYDSQVLQMRQQSFNMEQTAFATESLKDTVTTVQAMQVAARDMKKTMRTMDVDKVADLQDELSELMQDSNDIQELMGRSFAVPEGLDEADLEAELAALGDMGMAEGDDASYLDAIPAAPTGAVNIESEAEAKREPASMAPMK